jgi:transposase
MFPTPFSVIIFLLCSDQNLHDMAGKSIMMSKLKQILLQHSNGIGLQTISKTLGISRNTVKKYLRAIADRGYDLAELLKMSEESLEVLLDEPNDAARQTALEELFPYFEQELQRTGVNRGVLWSEYRRQYSDGYGYSQFCERLRQWLTAQSATLHLDHVPADKLFIDFTGKKLFIVDPESGEQIPVEIFVAILGYSQLTYAEAVFTQQLPDCLRVAENAWLYFGGVTRVIVPDNMKTAVDKADKFEAQLNRLFLELANHYQTSVLPARSYKPRDKSLVEGAVKIVYSRIFALLRNEVFYSLKALNEAIATLLEAHNNLPFQRKPQSRRQIFEAEERHALLPLPASRFEVKQYREVTVMKNCHVHLHDDRHYYSVPYRYIGKKVKLIYSASQVAVFYNKERIACHSRERKAYGYTTHKQHLPSTHQFVSDWNPDKFIQWAAAIDPVVKDYITHILDSKVYPEQAYRSCVGILSQERKVGRDRLVKAIARATQFGAYNYTTVHKILALGLDGLDEPAEPASGELPFHENIRGADHYQ